MPLRTEQLAKAGGSGNVGCPSVHLDLDDPAGDRLFVQGDGVVLVPTPSKFATVRIAAEIVSAALRGLGHDAPEMDPGVGHLFVSGPEVDIAFFPNPLPGEQVVRAYPADLLNGLRAFAGQDDPVVDDSVLA